MQSLIRERDGLSETQNGLVGRQRKPAELKPRCSFRVVGPALKASFMSESGQFIRAREDMVAGYGASASRVRPQCISGVLKEGKLSVISAATMPTGTGYSGAPTRKMSKAAY